MKNARAVDGTPLTMRYCHIQSNWDLSDHAWGPGFPATVLYGDLETRLLRLIDHGGHHLSADGHLNLTMLVFSEANPGEDTLSVIVTPVHSHEEASESQALLEQVVKESGAAWAMYLAAIRFTKNRGDETPDRAIMAVGRDKNEHLIALQYYEESGETLTFGEPEVFPTADTLLSGCIFQQARL
jgi:hypothetical protein